MPTEEAPSGEVHYVYRESANLTYSCVRLNGYACAPEFDDFGGCQNYSLHAGAYCRISASRDDRPFSAPLLNAAVASVAVNPRGDVIGEGPDEQSSDHK